MADRQPLHDILECCRRIGKATDMKDDRARSEMVFSAIEDICEHVIHAAESMAVMEQLYDRLVADQRNFIKLRVR